MYSGPYYKSSIMDRNMRTMKFAQGVAERKSNKHTSPTTSSNTSEIHKCKSSQASGSNGTSASKYFKRDVLTLSPFDHYQPFDGLDTTDTKDLKKTLEMRIKKRNKLLEYKGVKEERLKTLLFDIQNDNVKLRLKCQKMEKELDEARQKINMLEESLNAYNIGAREMNTETSNKKEEPVQPTNTSLKLKELLSEADNYNDIESMIEQIGKETTILINRNPLASSTIEPMRCDDIEVKNNEEQEIMAMCLEWNSARNSISTREELENIFSKMSVNNNTEAVPDKNIQHIPSHASSSISSTRQSVTAQDVDVPFPDFRRSLGPQLKKFLMARRAAGSIRSSISPKFPPGIGSSGCRLPMIPKKAASVTDAEYRPTAISQKAASIAGPECRTRTIPRKVPSVTDPGFPPLDPLKEDGMSIPNLRQYLPFRHSSRNSSIPKTATSLANCKDLVRLKKLKDNESSNSSPSRQQVSAQATQLESSLNSQRGVAVANPRHDHSLYTGVGAKCVYHAPPRMVPMGTVMKPVVSDTGAVKKQPKYKDITDSRTSKYCLIAQEQDTDGELETKLYKGNVVPTCGGGAQVIFNDVEKLKQSSPKMVRKVARRLY